MFLVLYLKHSFSLDLFYALPKEVQKSIILTTAGVYLFVVLACLSAWSMLLPWRHVYIVAKVGPRIQLSVVRLGYY